MLVRDQINREVSILNSPRRIVSLVPSITELVSDLGMSDALIGCTRFCVHPKDVVKDVSRIGGTKNPDITQIKALNPDLILANKEENERAHIEELGSLFPVYVSDVKNLDDNLDLIENLAHIFGQKELGDKIFKGIEKGFSDLSDTDEMLSAAYLIWRKPYMVAGGDSFISDIMMRSGFRNCFGSENRYPAKNIEAIAKAKPDVILLSSEPYKFTQKHCDEFATQIPGSLPVLVNGEMFSWYGSRMLQAAGFLSELKQIIRHRLRQG